MMRKNFLNRQTTPAFRLAKKGVKKREEVKITTLERQTPLKMIVRGGGNYNFYL